MKSTQKTWPRKEQRRIRAQLRRELKRTMRAYIAIVKTLEPFTKEQQTRILKATWAFHKL